MNISFIEGFPYPILGMVMVWKLNPVDTVVFCFAFSFENYFRRYKFSFSENIDIDGNYKEGEDIFQ